MQRCTGSTRGFKGIYREGSCGKVEFCLPTKLHAPSLADRVIGHMVSCAQRLRLIRAREVTFFLDKEIAMFMIFAVGTLKHRLTVRLTDEHVSHLNAIANASGLKRNEVVRRVLLRSDIPSARTRQEVQDLLRIQREQNRLGGLLKKALTERQEKAALRRTLVEVERNAAELRRVIAHLVRSR